jgi:hypothetical protein
MKIYLDSLDSFYSINQEAKTKPKKDYAGNAAIIFTFTVMSIVIALSIYTAYQIAYGQEDKPRCPEGYYRSSDGDCREKGIPTAENNNQSNSSSVEMMKSVEIMKAWDKLTPKEKIGRELVIMHCIQVELRPFKECNNEMIERVFNITKGR